MGKHSRVHGDFAAGLFEENRVVHRIPNMYPPSVVSETEEIRRLVGEYLRQVTSSGALSVSLSLVLDVWERR